MMALEYEDDIIIVDCGVQFPEEGMFGVDLIIPDISYLKERVDKVRAILITHGHEDHIGALPFILPQLQCPVYAPRLAHGLITAKLKERRAARDSVVNPIDPGVVHQIGEAFEVSWFRVCHSIPDAMGIAIGTPLGTVIHTGDFKIDHTPVDGRIFDLPSLSHYGDDGVLLLCSDSTYAEVPGYTTSERVVGEALDRAIGEAEGRVLVATFASLVSRVQQVVDAADKHGRKVSIVGRSMVDTVKVATDLGYLKVPEGTLVPLAETRKLAPEKVVLMTTGSQGEPTSALVRIAKQEHRDVNIMAGDTVVISATPIPGNELPVSHTIDNLLRQGAKVLYDRIATVHVHGHASQEELKLVLRLVRPKYFVPVHGEYRHLTAHAQLAWDLDVAKDGIFVMEDGDVLELSEGGARMDERVSAGPIFVDGLTTRDIQSPVLGERKSLSKDGVVVVIVTTDISSGKLVGEPAAVASGFLDESETGTLFEELSVAVAQELASNWSGTKENSENGGLKTKVKETARSFISGAVRRSPMIIPVVLEV
ncbi:Ribonuclease J2 (endoribonuclease in RNA processing) [hydrothermal vent metagenome]|uniref:Ribonuclease J2 (Endoribonuclease in RNA processing) n=1 Tax=hydrothermal vent metagenome TaxID=652676 RepID=A0A160V9C0_9ZZZZ